MTLQRKKSQRLVTTTPATSVGAALESIKPLISPKLLDGLEIQKVCSNGNINPRILTLSDDLFTLFVSHHKVGKKESLADRFQYKSFKAYATVVSSVTGMTVRATHDIRVIDVADILFVQSGYIGSRKLEACKAPMDPRKIISIFHNQNRTIDFLVEDEDRNALLTAIQTIREAYHASKVKVGREQLLLRYAWYDTDWDKSGLLEQSEFTQLLNRLNIYLKQEKAIQIFKEYVAAKYPKKGGRIGSMNHHGITFKDCLDILRKIKLEQTNGGTQMSDVIFNDLFGEKDVVTAEEFLTNFLRQKQEENATIDDVKRVFSELNSMEISGASYRIGADGKGDNDSIDRMRFGEYLTSSRNDLFNPEKQKFDSLTLSRPLSEYWINSSHNTYLTGDQLKSFSSVEMYVVAMQRGCKCLELDCWDDSVGYPIVYHGYTITSKIPFQDIITCVKHYVDDNPDTLPIILSLENHCSHPFQEILADILNKTLDDRLYVPESSSPLPSPLDLVGKVVVKGKRPPENDDDDLTASEYIEEELDPYSSVEDALVDSVSAKVGESSLISNLSRDVRDKLKLRSTTNLKNPDTPPQLPKIFPELARLTLFNGVNYKGFRASTDLPITDMHSFSEAKVLKVLNRDPANASLWKEYNREHMSRIYPAGSRVDSSNYNPIVAWQMGCQLVALNFQTDDSPMTINDGRFRENGRCGYVQKPLSVLPMTETSNSDGSILLRIKVLSGSCLPKPYGESVGEVIDPYVIVRVHQAGKRGRIRSSLTKRTTSGPVDWLETTERKTSSVRDNGFCPQWNESEYFSFSVTSDVSMVEIVVMDSDAGFIDDQMCKAAIPVSCLRQGIRSVQFYDQCSSQHGPFGMARVLVDVDIKHTV
eukprot:CAMPEP_0172305222 /NCGR_PEP_ID=MMETSP1058-20130122/6551_1 /TAXON_ID=83371 /ORGANISM="Detonula confervacea, Strain CCMP 353" /LENGTH=873 /DNA_ID=CAMNT_0013016751 /DNA_START=79 /DNA_END=2700 /DNA_ORIENTATION=-